MESCPFCDQDHPGRVAASELAVALRDGFPVVPGHLLIVPRRHVASFFELSADEQAAVLALAQQLRASESAADPSIEGWNVGINDGAAAGQTVMHAHLHLIPRRKGDVPHPRGGVRHVIPGKGDYLDERA